MKRSLETTLDPRQVRQRVPTPVTTLAVATPAVATTASVVGGAAFATASAAVASWWSGFTQWAWNSAAPTVDTFADGKAAGAAANVGFDNVRKMMMGKGKEAKAATLQSEAQPRVAYTGAPTSGGGGGGGGGDWVEPDDEVPWLPFVLGLVVLGSLRR